MRNLFWSSRPVKSPGPRGNPPQVETLEDRQPVSDTLLGGMLAGSILGLDQLVANFTALEVSAADQAPPELAGTIPARGGKGSDRDVSTAAPPVERNVDRAGPRSAAPAVANHSLPPSSDWAGPRPGEWTPRAVPLNPEMGSARGGNPSAPGHPAAGLGSQPPAAVSVTGAGRAAEQALLMTAGTQTTNPAPRPSAPTADPRRAVETSSADNPLQAPVSYEVNEGQTNPAVQFLTRGPGYTLFLTSGAAVLSFGDGAVIRMRLTGANPTPQVVGLDPLPGRVNYFRGNDPAGWHAGIPTFARVRYQDVYPGIDLVYHGSAGRPEYDFVMAPGVDPAAVRLNYAGADRVAIDAEGSLVVRAGGAELRQPAPVAYQLDHGVRRIVPSAFQLGAGQEVRFAVGAYDRDQPLVIDPYFAFSTYLGGSGNDQGWGVATDPAGDVFVAGFTDSTDFPGNPPPQGSRDVFVSLFSADGQVLEYSTILGGYFTDEARGVTVDGQGNAYVTGFTDSPNFPLQNPFQRQLLGPRDAFVTELDPGGGLVYSSYLGGLGLEEGRGIAVDANGSAYVTGVTSSQNGFIFNSGGLQPRFGGGNTDAFVVQVLPGGEGRGFSTYLGGSGDENVGFNDPRDAVLSGGIAVGPDGNVYVTGTTASPDFLTVNPFQPDFRGPTDAFVTAIDPNQLAFFYSTYLGGPGEDQGHGIAVGPNGSIDVAGATASPDFPLANPYQPQFGGGKWDAFVAQLFPDGSAPLFSTYLGGGGDDQAHSVAATALASVYVTGETASADFPVQDAFQRDFGGGPFDAFVAKFLPGGGLRTATFLGGPRDDQGRAVAAVPRAARGACAAGPLPPGDGCDDYAVMTGFSSGGYPLANAFQSAFGGPPYDAVVSEVVDCPCQPSNVQLTVDDDGIAHLSWDDLCEDYTSEYDIRIWVDGVEQTPATVYPPDHTADIDGGGGQAEFEIKSVNSCCDSPAVHAP